MFTPSLPYKTDSENTTTRIYNRADVNKSPSWLYLLGKFPPSEYRPFNHDRQPFSRVKKKVYPERYPEQLTEVPYHWPKGVPLDRFSGSDSDVMKNFGLVDCDLQCVIMKTEWENQCVVVGISNTLPWNVSLFIFRFQWSSVDPTTYGVSPKTLT